MVNVFALAAGNAAEMTFSERLSTAGIVSLQGLLTIFLVLTILWGAIELLHYALVGRKEKAAKKESVAPAEAPVESAAPVVETPAPVVSDDGAIIAAITAAISAQLASDGYTGGFRVVSFKRAGNTKGRRA